MGDLHQRDLLEISTYDTAEDEALDTRVEEFNGEVPNIPVPEVDETRFAVLMPVGKPLYNWLNDVLLSVRILSEENDVRGLPTGDCKLMMYSHGLAFNKGLKNYCISFDQVLAVYPLTATALEKRQTAGGVLCPEDGRRVRRFVLEYWDILTCQPVQLILQSHKAPYIFMARLQREMTKRYEAENRCKYVYNVFGRNQALDAAKFTDAARIVPAYVIAGYVAEMSGRPKAEVLAEAGEVLRPVGLKVEKPMSPRWINIAILITLGITVISLLASL